MSDPAQAKLQIAEIRQQITDAGLKVDGVSLVQGSIILKRPSILVDGYWYGLMIYSGIWVEDRNSNVCAALGLGEQLNVKISQKVMSGRVWRKGEKHLVELDDKGRFISVIEDAYKNSFYYMITEVTCHPE